MTKAINATLPGSYSTAFDTIRQAWPWYNDVKNNAIVKKAVEELAEKARASLKEALSGILARKPLRALYSRSSTAGVV